MTESHSSLSIGKVKLPRFLGIETLMYLDFNRALEFLFATNRQLRSFLEHNYQTINRGFENEGLFINHLDMTHPDRIYGTLKYLDKVCQQAALRREDN